MGAGAEPAGAGQQSDRGVFVEFDDGVALLLDAGIGAGAVHLAAQAPASPPRSLALSGPSAHAPPVTFLDPAPNAILESVADDRVARGGHVACADRVRQLELGGIESQALCRFVDRRSSA